MSSWTQAQNDAGWRLGFGGWLVGLKRGVVATHGAFIALLDAEADFIERQWDAVEAALPHIVIDPDGETRAVLPSDPAAGLRVARAITTLGWWGDAPDEGAIFDAAEKRGRPGRSWHP